MLNEDLGETVVAPASEERREHYVYIIYRPNGVPCYVGKGKGERWRMHALCARRGVSRNKWLERIFVKANYKLDVVKIQEGLTDEEAISLEIALIAEIGRANKKRGPLVNFTDGGDGISGSVRSRQTIEKIAASNRGKKRSPETCARLREIKLGTKQSAETIEKKAAAIRGRAKSPEHAQRLRDALIRTSEIRRIAISKAHKGRPKNALEIASKPLMQKGHKKSEEQKAKMSASHKGVPLSREHIEARSAALRGKKRSEETRERMRQSQRARLGSGDLCAKGHAPDWLYETNSYGNKNRRCRPCKNERQRKASPILDSPSLFDS